jgi:hypothetical protein
MFVQIFFSNIFKKYFSIILQILVRISKWHAIPPIKEHCMAYTVNTVKPVYNELGYNKLPLITKHIVCTDRIDFLIK